MNHAIPVLSTAAASFLYFTSLKRSSAKAGPEHGAARVRLGMLARLAAAAAFLHFMLRHYNGFADIILMVATFEAVRIAMTRRK